MVCNHVWNHYIIYYAKHPRLTKKLEVFRKRLFGQPCTAGTVKAMATHSSVLAWRIPGVAEPGWLLSMGSHRVGHNWSDLAAAAAAAYSRHNYKTLLTNSLTKALIITVLKLLFFLLILIKQNAQMRAFVRLVCTSVWTSFHTRNALTSKPACSSQTWSWGGFKKKAAGWRAT